MLVHRGPATEDAARNPLGNDQDNWDQQDHPGREFERA